MATKVIRKIAVSDKTAKQYAAAKRGKMEKMVQDIAKNFEEIYRKVYTEEKCALCSSQEFKSNLRKIANQFAKLYAEIPHKDLLPRTLFTRAIYSEQVHRDIANNPIVTPYKGYYSVNKQGATLNVDKVLEVIMAGGHPPFMPYMDTQIRAAVADNIHIKAYSGYYSVVDEGAVLDQAKVIATLNRGKYLPFFPENVFSDDTLTGDSIAVVLGDFLACDQKRAGLEGYPQKMIFDPNGGHWDLWDADAQGNESDITLTEGITARDPASDIDSGIVAIDFGTKNTVVVYENDHSEQLPLNIGGRLVGSMGYENPTVVEFCDLNNFLKAYGARDGRPFTSWNQVTVGHQAAENMRNSSSDRYYSFFDELKTWCIGAQKRGKIKDGKGCIEELPTFLDFPDDKVSPIEIYAYYIGVFINNMHRGKIFLDYVMSFPVTFPENVREKIRRCFEKGLKKSLPTGLLTNNKVMENFHVRIGASEPAAYAVTALTEYGFVPSGEDSCYYGVFDFGGGTTDFDFGVYRAASKEQRRYDYELLHFGAGGDKTLGGENLLRLLAFDIFCVNSKRLMTPNIKGGDVSATKIPFTQAAEPREFPGSDLMVSRDSEEACANMHILMEKLRPLWEEPESEISQKLKEGVIVADLFNEQGELLTGVQLLTKAQEDAENFFELDLENILKSRIEGGIRQFFLTLGEAFRLAHGERQDIKSLSETDSVAIFLAGNSSKSKWVQEIFRKYIEDENLLQDLFLGERLPQFEIFPPLGTEEAREKQRELQILNPPREDEPTGKTGVAYGLLSCRDSGGGILVKTITPGAGGILFRYYIGYKAGRRFCPVIYPKSDQKYWEYFIDGSNDFDLYYTENAEAVTGEASITIATRHRVCLSQPDADKNVYLRPAGVATLEYVLAKSEEELTAMEHDGRLDIQKIELP